MSWNTRIAPFVKSGATRAQMASALGVSKKSLVTLVSSYYHSIGADNTSHAAKVDQLHRVMEKVKLTSLSSVYETNAFKHNGARGEMNKGWCKYSDRVIAKSRKDGDWIDVTHLELFVHKKRRVQAIDIDGFGPAFHILEAGILRMLDTSKTCLLFTSWLSARSYNFKFPGLARTAHALLRTDRPNITHYNSYIIDKALFYGFKAELVDVAHYGVWRLAHKLTPIRMSKSGAGPATRIAICAARDSRAVVGTAA